MAKEPTVSKRASAPKKGRHSSGDGSEADLKTGAGSEPDSDFLPGPEEIAALLAPVRTFMQDERLSKVRLSLSRLSHRPPQVLLLEGGTVEERLAAAHYWALCLNCMTRHPVAETDPASLSLLPGLLPVGEENIRAPELAEAVWREPCLECTECIRMVTHLHRDCIYLDGLAGSIKIEEVRNIRQVLGEPPREARSRVVFFREAQALLEAAANALLKSFEEPNPGTSFVLLTPQRERLLPTLVSRSMVLTLPWPDTHLLEKDDSLIPWEAALCTFLETGRGWFERTGVKGALDTPTAHAIVNLCRQALVARLTSLQSGKDPEEGLERVFALLPEQRLRMLDELLAECQDSLIFTVNPALVMEWFATKLYLLVPRQSGRLSGR